ncbi:MAG: hypothetical protein ACRCWR_01965, partial [Saezia sp.]
NEVIAMPFYLVSAVQYEDKSKTKIKSAMLHCSAKISSYNVNNELPENHIANLPQGIIVSREQLIQAASSYRVVTVAMNLVDFSFEYKEAVVVVKSAADGIFIKTEHSHVHHDDLGHDLVEF